MTPEPQPAETPEPRAERSQGEPTGVPQPCPFCGCYSMEVVLYNKPSVLCKKCDANGPSAQRLLVNVDNREEAKAKAWQLWNTRAALRPNDVATESPSASTESAKDEALRLVIEKMEAIHGDEPIRIKTALPWALEVRALRAELAKVRGEFEAIKCPTTHQAIVKQLVADRARLEADCLALRAALESLREDIASDVIDDSDKARTARRLSQLKMIGHALASTAGDELRGVLKQVRDALIRNIELCNVPGWPPVRRTAIIDEATAALAALSRFLPQEEP